MALVIETRSPHGPVSRTHLRAGTTRLNVRPGETFRIYDEDTGQAPAHALVKQLDNSILVEHLADRDGQGQQEAQTVELLGFYSSCSISDPCHLELPGSTPIDITPSTAAIGALSDGTFVLYDPAHPAATASGEPAGWAGNPASGDHNAHISADAGTHDEPLISESTRPIIYGLGGAAVLGLALAGGGGGGGGGNDSATSSSPTSPASPAAPPAPAVTPAGSDPALTVTHASVAKGAIPTLTGTGTAGATIQIDVHAAGTSTVDAAYSVTVGADGKWSANLATLKPATGTLPAGGLSTATSLSLTENVNGKASSLPDFHLTADDTPPAAPTFNPVGNDNLLGASSHDGPLNISGHGDAGSLIKLTLGAQTHEATVGADGAWAVTVPATALPADGNTQLSVTASDLAGNVSKATTQTLTIDTTPPAAPVIQATGGNDHYINAAEKAAGVTLSGSTEPGATLKVSLGGAAHDASVGADGKWSLLLGSADLPADGNYTVTATATDKAGNVSAPAAGQPLTVDTKAPVLTDVHAGDNDRIQGGTFLISGKTESGATVKVEYKLLSGTTQSQEVKVADTGGDAVPWAIPDPIVAIPPLLGATEVVAHITATDKAGNSTALDHHFLLLSQNFPFGPSNSLKTLGLDDLSSSAHDTPAPSSTHPQSIATAATNPGSTAQDVALLAPLDEHAKGLTLS